MFAHIITYQGLHLPEREGRRYFHQRFVVAEHADVHRCQRVLLRVRRPAAAQPSALRCVPFRTSLPEILQEQTLRINACIRAAALRMGGSQQGADCNTPGLLFAMASTASGDLSERCLSGVSAVCGYDF